MHQVLGRSKPLHQLRVVILAVTAELRAFALACLRVLHQFVAHRAEIDGFLFQSERHRK
jgi:hypothetical protein